MPKPFLAHRLFQFISNICTLGYLLPSQHIHFSTAQCGTRKLPSNLGDLILSTAQAVYTPLISRIHYLRMKSIKTYTTSSVFKGIRIFSPSSNIPFSFGLGSYHPLSSDGQSCNLTKECFPPRWTQQPKPLASRMKKSYQWLDRADVNCSRNHPISA